MHQVQKVINIDRWLEFTHFDKAIFLSEILTHKLQKGQPLFDI